MQLYIIASVGQLGCYMPPVKIGISTNTDRRLRELNCTACPYKLAIYRTIDLDNETARLVEKKLHESTWKTHTTREWFDVTPEEATANLRACLISLFMEKGKTYRDAVLRSELLIYGED